MNFPIAGTISNMMKMTQMTMKWEQKKSNLGKEERLKKEQSEPPEIKRLKEITQQTKRANYIEGLRSKMKCGGELTKDELEYLKAESPELYQDAIETKAEREQYKRELENCRTKEEVDRLNINKMNSYVSQAKTISANPNIPKAKKIQLLDKIMAKVMGVNTEFSRFVKSGAYDGLPSEESKEKKKVTRKEQPELKEETYLDVFDNAKTEIENELEGAVEIKNSAPTPEFSTATENVVDEPTNNSKVNIFSAASAYVSPTAKLPNQKLSVKI